MRRIGGLCSLFDINENPLFKEGTCHLEPGVILKPEKPRNHTHSTCSKIFGIHLPYLVTERVHGAILNRCLHVALVKAREQSTYGLLQEGSKATRRTCCNKLLCSTLCAAYEIPLKLLW